ncbi:MAG: thermonuclease family protein [Akkermansia sp.]|nr:thermonuclease family protein [Akkermansia sp.]
MMHALKALLMALLAVCLFSCTGDAPTAGTLEGKVVRISDGDTVTIETDNGTRVKIRLNGIDAPESGQEFGKESRAKIAELIDGEVVTVKTHSHDRYNRVIGEIFLDGRNINRAMVQEGCAWHYVQYAPKDKDLANDQEQAKKAGKGLWANPNAVPPWEYRKKK